MRFVGLLGLVAFVAIGAYVGCGPRGQVAMDKITDRLDRALGEMTIQRKNIENKQTELRKQLETVKEQRIKSEVKLELLADKKQKLESVLNEVKGKIEQVNDLLKEANSSESKSIARNGKTYSANDLQNAANEVAMRFRNEKAQLDATIAGHNALEASVAFLKKQEAEAARLMNELGIKISEIDAKKIAVDAVRDNSEFIAGDNKSISANLEALTKDIEKLGIDVETALRIETSKMNEIAKTDSVADDLLSQPPDLDATQKMLEDLLK
jgi:chromosome segregation ATPase